MGTSRQGAGASGERFYIDCEFDGHGGPLLSFAIVRDNGFGLHMEITDAPAPVDPWVAENVLPILESHEADCVCYLKLNEVGPRLKAFIGDCTAPVIVADSPVDIGRFCAAISTDREGDWASTGYQRMTFEVHNVDCYPTTLEGAVQHNAWWDAMALRHKLAARQHRPSEGKEPPMPTETSPEREGSETTERRRVKMGTKANPAKFDCYANALPDEPMFILLARSVKTKG